MQPAPAIHIENLASRYGGLTVFEDLTFTMRGGELLVLLGPSGVGKTTLLRMIAGLDAPSAGQITASDGQPLAQRIAYMGQQDLLLPWASLLDNVTLGARLRRQPKNLDLAHNLIGRVGLAGREKALPAQLSGGMRQRAALARTLYEQRPIVLMDEPFSALDTITRARIQDLASELLAGCTTLLITHDPQEACRLGHRLLILAGDPPCLRPPLVVPGPPPRASDDPAVLQTQGAQLRELAA